MSASSETPELSPELPPVSFARFVMSLAASAMAALGEGPPGTPVDLVMARNTIDVLGVLKDKTVGNLDAEEQKMLDTLLFEARTKFVEKTR